jgi:hypothetical protein
MGAGGPGGVRLPCEKAGDVPNTKPNTEITANLSVEFLIIIIAFRFCCGLPLFFLSGQIRNLFHPRAPNGATAKSLEKHTIFWI